MVCPILDGEVPNLVIRLNELGCKYEVRMIKKIDNVLYPWKFGKQICPFSSTDRICNSTCMAFEIGWPRLKWDNGCSAYAECKCTTNWKHSFGYYFWPLPQVDKQLFDEVVYNEGTLGLEQRGIRVQPLEEKES